MALKSQSHMSVEERYLLEAKAFFDRTNEPVISNDHVLIRELCYAVERAFGATKDELAFGEISEVYESVISALIGGQLIAFTHEDEEAIPSVEWEVYARRGVSAVGSNFWTGRIFIHAGSERYEGKLPVLTAADAIEWISQEVRLRDKARFVSTDETESAFNKWVATFPVGAKPTVTQRETWYRKHGISRERGREINDRLAPPYWHKPGRKKQN